jgi:hypothetical protein
LTSRRRTKALRGTSANHVLGSDAPPTAAPTLGWANRHWNRYTSCVVETCGKRIRAGVVHHRDQADPPRSAMCLECYGALMGDPDKFREEHPSEAAGE